MGIHLNLGVSDDDGATMVMNAPTSAPPVLRHPWGGPTDLDELLAQWAHLLPTGRQAGGVFSLGIPLEHAKSRSRP